MRRLKGTATLVMMTLGITKKASDKGLMLSLIKVSITTHLHNYIYVSL